MVDPHVRLERVEGFLQLLPYLFPVAGLHARPLRLQGPVVRF